MHIVTFPVGLAVRRCSHHLPLVCASQSIDKFLEEIAVDMTDEKLSSTITEVSRTRKESTQCRGAGKPGKIDAVNVGGQRTR
jgi:hypothetical protein